MRWKDAFWLEPADSFYDYMPLNCFSIPDIDPLSSVNHYCINVLSRMFEPLLFYSFPPPLHWRSLLRLAKVIRCFLPPASCPLASSFARSA